MKRGLLVFLSICAFAIAAVPKDRRVVNTEEHMTICKRQVPCAWAVYKPITKIVELKITNTYCYCGIGTFCVQNEDDEGSSSFIYRCREPAHDEQKAEEPAHDEQKADN